MEITLRPQTADRIRQALGDEVDLAPSAVASALARLSVEAPTVYSEVLAEISGTHIRLDSERVLAQKRRSALWRKLLFSWGEYQSDAGDHLIAKRHVAAAVPLGLAGLLLLALAGSALLGHRAPAVTGHAGMPARPHPVVSLRARAARAVAAPLSSLPAIPPFPSGAGPAPWDLADGSPAPTRTAPVSPGNPLVLIFDVAQPSRTPAALSSTGAIDGRESALRSPIVFEQTTESAPNADSVPSHPSPDVNPAQNAVQWVTGERVAARLATGIVAASSGSPTPVIAETSDPAATWLGQATLGADGRVQVAFTLSGTAEAVRGVALDPVRLTPGLVGSTTLRQPEAAAAALTAAAQAAASYARALAQDGQVTLSSGLAELALGQPGPAWTYLASSLADGITPRSGVPGPVETSEIAAGAPVLILVIGVH